MLLLALLIFGGLSTVSLILSWPYLMGKATLDSPSVNRIENTSDGTRKLPPNIVLIIALCIVGLICAIFVFVPYNYIREALYLATGVITIITGIITIYRFRSKVT